MRQSLMNDRLELVDVEWSMQYEAGNATDSRTMKPNRFARIAEVRDRDVIANRMSL